MRYKIYFSLILLISIQTTTIIPSAEIKQESQQASPTINFTKEEFEYIYQCQDPIYLNNDMRDALKIFDQKLFEQDQAANSLLKACNENFKFHSMQTINTALLQIKNWLDKNKETLSQENYDKINFALNDYQNFLENNDATVIIKEKNKIECNLLTQDCCQSKILFDGQEIPTDIQAQEVDALTRAPNKVFRQPVVIRFESNSQNALTVFGSTGFNGVVNFRERANFFKNARVQQNLNVDGNANIDGNISGANANISGTTTTTSLNVAGGATIAALTATTANVLSGMTVGGQLLNNGSQVLTTIANAGSGQGIFESKTSATANLKSLVAGSNINLDASTPGQITINATGSGDVTNAANLGAGAGVFANKTGSILNFKSLTAGSNITITPSATEIQISATSGGSGDVVGPASATDNAIARFDGTTGKLIQNSAVTVDDSGNVTTAGNLELSTNPSTTTAGNITKGGTLFLHNLGSTTNTYVGLTAGDSTTSGTSNTAVGSAALTALTTGSNNTAVGQNALAAITTISNCTAIGNRALEACTVTGNVAIGHVSQLTNSTGSQNTSVGTASLQSLTSGSRNIAFGQLAGSQLIAGNDNISIRTGILAGDESNTIRIGGTTGTGSNQQNRCFISGIRGITTGVADAIPVLIDSANQLGTVSSSLRYKKDIQDMANSSNNIMQLRPVNFKYKEDKSESENYGLIAEEVAQVMPELVVHDKEGNPETVKYHILPVLLLNELKKLRSEFEQYKLTHP